MPQTGTNPNKDQMTVRAPYEVKKAFSNLAHELNGRNEYVTITTSDIQREAYYEYILNHWDDLPEQTRGDVDRDRLRKEVDEGPGAGV